MPNQKAIEKLEQEWADDARWAGIVRPYTAEQVERMRGTVRIDHSLARQGAERLWHLIHTEPFVRALGAMTGNQAVQMVQAGLKAIYLSGWQVAADNNISYQTYPDQSLYPMNSAPRLTRRINNALMRADQIAYMNDDDSTHWMVPIVADAESGFGGPLNTFELIKEFIDAGAAAVHLEDQLSSMKKCGHMGGKVLVPVGDFVRKLVSARFAADLMGVPTVIVARTDADSATLLRGAFDDVDSPFITGERTVEGFYVVKNGVDYAIARGLAYAPYADMLWCETSTPDLGEARAFAQGIHEQFPGKPLAYNCSPSFNWRLHMDEREAATFQEQLGEMGYQFQFVTLAGFHSLNTGMFDLARNYRDEGMAAYSRLQQHEFALAEQQGYTAVRHQAFVGVGYFDELQQVFTGGESSTVALAGSTEEAQFETS